MIMYTSKASYPDRSALRMWNWIQKVRKCRNKPAPEVTGKMKIIFLSEHFLEVLILNLSSVFGITILRELLLFNFYLPGSDPNGAQCGNESGSALQRALRIRNNAVYTLRYLDVEYLIAGHDEVAEADDGPLPHGQAGRAQLGLQGLQQVRVELDQQTAKSATEEGNVQCTYKWCSLVLRSRSKI